ncbi:ABC transporter ATP-binding protein [Tessaracoccus palaemonis]|uniref:ABC transporter ATP-binding protein n=1 Tax=Tessaracoccus palaemonis TaxID=2829499 RepID=A0ABX8SH43_9ACTN|nr:ABC transporter ATP-binding protein [Tessaracoccus palaemonis]QXT61802.1 ABC transporter ATP-binding protein [Tessaracoccus palaemonis]
MTTSHQLSAESVSLGYDQRTVVDGLDLDVPPGRLTVIVGANACGKSTLLRGLARLLAPTSGKVLLDGHDIHTMPTSRVATLLGLLPQSPIAPDSITVADLVSRGRYPHQGWLRRGTANDDEIVDEAMASAGVIDLAERSVDELSGGQRQRVWIAMALAQATDLLLLDEPTTYLDISHQIDVLDLLADLNERRGTTVVMVLHELALACRYAEHLIAMKDGRIVAQGAPVDIVDAALVKEVFGIDSEVLPDPVSGTPMVAPYSRRHRPVG